MREELQKIANKLQQIANQYEDKNATYGNIVTLTLAQRVMSRAVECLSFNIDDQLRIDIMNDLGNEKIYEEMIGGKKDSSWIDRLEDHMNWET